MTSGPDVMVHRKPASVRDIGRHIEVGVERVLPGKDGVRLRLGSQQFGAGRLRGQRPADGSVLPAGRCVGHGTDRGRFPGSAIRMPRREHPDVAERSEETVVGARRVEMLRGGHKRTTVRVVPCVVVACKALDGSARRVGVVAVVDDDQGHAQATQLGKERLGAPSDHRGAQRVRGGAQVARPAHTNIGRERATQQRDVGTDRRDVGGLDATREDGRERTLGRPTSHRGELADHRHLPPPWRTPRSPGGYRWLDDHHVGPRDHRGDKPGEVRRRGDHQVGMAEYRAGERVLVRTQHDEPGVLERIGIGIIGIVEAVRAREIDHEGEVWPHPVHPPAERDAGGHHRLHRVAATGKPCVDTRNCVDHLHTGGGELGARNRAELRLAAHQCDIGHRREREHAAQQLAVPGIGRARGQRVGVEHDEDRTHLTTRAATRVAADGCGYGCSLRRTCTGG